MMKTKRDKRNIKTKAYFDFLEQIIACHAWHTVICNNKIHFHFLQNHKQPKDLFQKTQKENDEKK